MISSSETVDARDLRLDIVLVLERERERDNAAKKTTGRDRARRLSDRR